MNKYSSKAVKTAATVGMSLAMVLSNAAPVFAAAPIAVCDGTDDTAAKCKTIFYDLSKAIEKIGLEELNVESEATIDGTDDVRIIATIIVNKAGLEKHLTGSDYTTFRKWMDVVNIIAADTETGKDSKGMFSTAYFTSDANDTEKTGGLVNFYATQLAAGGEWNGSSLKDNASAAVKAYEKMTKWIEDGYYDRLDEKLSNRFDTVYNDLEEAASDYVVSDDKVTDLFVAAWTTVLEQDLDGKDKLDFGKNVDAFEKETKYTSGVTETINLSSKTDIKKRISDIKDAPNYYRVKNEDAVQDIIAQYEDLLDTITDLKDILKTNAYKAYTSTKVEEALTGDDSTVRSIVKKFTDSEDTEKKSASAWAKTLSNEQYEILKALKEDVLDEVYNFETKKVGNYYVDKSGWVDGFTGTSTLKTDLGADAYDIFFKLVDTKEGLFGIDVVMNHLTDFVDAWDAVTTDIEKLTPANIKASDKATLEAAEDAIYEMSNEKGKYVNNLTKSQTKEIRKIQTKIDNLREAFDNLGVTNAAGWYDMGNGNWGYNNEDGTPAAYKWVASGSDWYMIKDGKMLRNTWLATDGGRWYYLDNAGKMVTNQSVDGCWINSYGVYMSPSYNG